MALKALATSSAVNEVAHLPPLPTIRDLVKLYNLRAIKQLSQNFLMDERLTNKIVKAVGRISNNDIVLEVGPGPGGITRSILRKNPGQLILVEKDRRFLPTLELLQECAKPMGIPVDIYREDILRFSMDKINTDEVNRLHLVGNLPFSISTRLLINWLNDLSLKQGAFRIPNTGMTLTFQKEVADRICAAVGHDQRCRLSVMSEIWTKPLLRFIIPGKAFIPKPKVDVGVVKLIPLEFPKTDLPFGLVEKVVRHIFSMRQKYCRRGYQTLFPPEVREEIVEKLFNLADVQSTLRPFQLSAEEHLRLATVYSEWADQNPELATYNYRGPKVRKVDVVGEI